MVVRVSSGSAFQKPLPALEETLFDHGEIGKHPIHVVCLRLTKNLQCSIVSGQNWHVASTVFSVLPDKTGISGHTVLALLGHQLNHLVKRYRYDANHTVTYPRRTFKNNKKTWKPILIYATVYSPSSTGGKDRQRT